MRRNIIYNNNLTLSASVLMVALFFAGCGKQQAAQFTPPPTPVEIADVQSVTVTDKFEAVGTIEAGEAITVVSEVDAAVNSLPFIEGQNIEKGGLIAVLDDQLIAAAFASAEATRDQARINYERTKSIVEAGAGAKQELDVANANLKVAEAQFEQARVRLAKTKIRAPFAGVLGARLVSPGAFLRSGFSLSTPITTLTQIDRLKVTFTAPERVFSLLHRGSEVAISTPAYPGYSLTGKIDVVDPVVDPITRSVRIFARMANPDQKFRPGMSASVIAVLGERPNSLIIPDEAVFAEGNQAFVFVVQPDNSVLRTPITLGARQAATVEVITGLSAGAKVIRAGHQKLYDGAKVMLAGAKPPAEATPPDSTAQPAATETK